MAVQFVENDTGSVLQVTCTDDDTGAVIDLTGAVLILRYKIKTALAVEKTMVITPPATNGIATYQFLSGELTPGPFRGEVQITDAGVVTTSLNDIELDIKPRKSLT